MDEEEFFNKLSTLRADTSLGDIVAIRAEKNKDIIKNFNSSQRAIYNQWKNREKQTIKLTEEEILKKQRFVLNYFKSLK